MKLNCNVRFSYYFMKAPSEGRCCLAQENIIKELTAQMKLKEPLLHSTTATVLNLLTREAADEEKQMLEKDVLRWKNVADEHKKFIEEHKKRIHELQQIGWCRHISRFGLYCHSSFLPLTEKDLRLELKAEIDRSNSLAAKASKVPGSALRSRPGGVDDPKQAEVMRFYEDMTNIIIPSVKASKGRFFDLDEWVLSCVYTHADPANPTSSNVGKSTCRFYLANASVLMSIRFKLHSTMLLR